MKLAIAMIDKPLDNTTHYRGEKLVKPGTKERINPRLVCLLAPLSAEAENYHRLRHAVENLRVPGRGIVIGITSAGMGDGKTLTAINLAGALAQDAAASVLLVDLDLRRQGDGISQYLDLKARSGPGVADLIRNPQPGNDAVTHYLADFNLYLAEAGTASGSPYELLKSPALDSFLQQARQRHDFIIIDTTQVLNLPDTQLLSARIDGFLFVIRADRTTAAMLAESLNLMQPDKVLGLVFNGDAA